MSNILQIKPSAFRQKGTRHVSGSGGFSTQATAGMGNAAGSGRETEPSTSLLSNIGVDSATTVLPEDYQEVNNSRYNISTQRKHLDENPDTAGNVSSVQKPEEDVQENRTIDNLNNGIIELTKNTKYCVLKLPAAPSVLLNGDEVMYDGFVDQRSTSALIVAPRGMFIWNYTSPDHSPNTLVFENAIFQQKLLELQQQKNAADIDLDVDLDLDMEAVRNSVNGALLANLIKPSSGYSEPGLFTIESESGKCTYWESVGGAVADGLLHNRKGLHHTVMLHQEVVETIQNIEPAGLVLTTSVGRFILVTLRDEYGKPYLSSHSMRPGGSGILGTISSAIKFGPSQRGIVSVKKGRRIGHTECEALFINTKFDVSIWEVSRTGKSRAIVYEHLRESLVKAIEGLYPGARQSLTAHDLERHPKEPFVFVLASFVNSGYFYYILFTLKLIEDPDNGGGCRFIVFSAHRLQSYSRFCQYPRIILPGPFDTLYLVFNKAVVLLDALPVELENGALTRWEDCVTLQNDIDIIGSGGEDVNQISSKVLKHSGVVLLAKNYGVIRIERYPETETSQRQLLVVDESQDPFLVQRNIAISKIEQAVFYGQQSNNPINFEVAHEKSKFDPHALEEAAIQVSHDILTTSTSYVPPMFPSLKEHLNLRVTFLGRLVSYLRASFLEYLSVDSRYQLLWDFERASAARSLWSYIDERVSHNAATNAVFDVVLNTSKATTTTASSSSSSSSSSEKKGLHQFRNTNSEQDDAIGDWFLFRTDKINTLFVALSEYCKTKNTYEVVVDVNNALIRAVLMSGLDVRTQYIEKVYGLNPSTDFSAECPWTCQQTMIDIFESQYSLSVHMMNSVGASSELIDQLVVIVDGLCMIYTDRINWLRHHPTKDGVHQNNSSYVDLSDGASEGNSGATRRQPAANAKELDSLVPSFKARQRQWLNVLVNSGQSASAIKIATRFHIYRSLAEILGDNLLRIKSSGVNELGSTAKAQEAEIIKKLKEYGEQFGYDFCQALFQYWVDTKQFKLLLTVMLPEFNQELGEFLMASDIHNRYAWIHYVKCGDYLDAADTLTVDAAHDNGDSISNKKVELSIAKLCAIAESNKRSEVTLDANGMDVDGGEDQEELLSNITTQLERVNVQEAIKNQLDLDKDPFGVAQTKNCPGLVEVMERAMDRLKDSKSLSVTELVNLLTLIPSEPVGNSQFNFYRALFLIKESDLNGDTKQALEQLVWLRLLQATDWAKLCGNNGRMSDAEVQNAAESSVIYKTLELASTPQPQRGRVLSNYSMDLLTTEPVDKVCAKVDTNVLQNEIYAYLDRAKFKALVEEIQSSQQDIQALESQYKISSWIKGVYAKIHL